jgi:hypothetical protein
MRLLLENQLPSGKRIPEKLEHFAASGLFLSRLQAKSRFFFFETVDWARFCGTLKAAEPENVRRWPALFYISTLPAQVHREQ